VNECNHEHEFALEKGPFIKHEENWNYKRSDLFRAAFGDDKRLTRNTKFVSEYLLDLSDCLKQPLKRGV
jgi:hypothetical protein